MITLIDAVEIDAPLDALYEWLLALDKNFVKWSPYHRRFKKRSGGFGVGDRIWFCERVSGVTYRVGGVIKTNEKNRDGFKMVFETMSGLSRIYFIGGKTDGGCSFTHIEEFGKPNTKFGRFLNRLLFCLLFRRRANWQLIQNDMVLDNTFLKQILETGVYPERKRKSCFRHIGRRRRGSATIPAVLPQTHQAKT